MQRLITALKTRLKGAKRIAVLGIGSDLRGDDAAGIISAEWLLKRIPKQSRKFKVYVGSTAPENLTGEIKRFAPTHLVIIDSIEAGERPGTVILLDPGKIGGGVSFSTHNMPAQILIDYLSASFKCKTVMIGVQPSFIAFGKPVSGAVNDAAKKIASAIRDAI